MSAPWPHVVRWSDLSRGPASLTLSADADALARIAEDLDLPAVKRLDAAVVVRPWLDGAAVEARLSATVTQTCGVSLEDFDAEVDETFEVKVVPAGSANAPGAESDEVELDPEADDPPDVAEGEGIDVGAYVVEHLALALDPFPRKPDAAFEAPQEAPPVSPFAALQALKDRQGDR